MAMSVNRTGTAGGSPSSPGHRVAALLDLGLVMIPYLLTALVWALLCLACRQASPVPRSLFVSALAWGVVPAIALGVCAIRRHGQDTQRRARQAHIEALRRGGSRGP